VAFKELPFEMMKLAKDMYQKYKCRKITHDKRDRCNPIVIYSMMRPIYYASLKEGIDWRDVDIQHESDPDQSARWNIAHLTSFIVGSKLLKEGLIETAEESDEHNPAKMREVEDAYEDMQLSMYEEYLKKLKVGKIPPEFEGLSDEEIQRKITELEQFLREKLKWEGVKQEEEKEWLGIEEEVKVAGLPPEQLGPDEEVKIIPPPELVPTEAPALLPMARIYVDYLRLNVEGKIKSYRINKEVVCYIPIVDEGTGEIVYAVYPFPRAQRERFAMLNITNKEGREVSVLVPISDEMKVLPLIATEEEMKVAIESAEKEVPEIQPPTIPVDWKYVKDITGKFQEWIDKLLEQATKRSDAGLLMYLDSIIEFADEAIETVKKGSYDGFAQRVVERPPPVYKVLRDDEYEDLWKAFSKELKEVGIDPRVYRDRFDELIDWGMNKDDNIFIIMDEARSIIAIEFMRGRVKRIEKYPQRFSWKLVRWGLSSMAFDIQSLKDAISEENFLQALRSFQSLKEAADKLRGYVLGV